MIASTHMAFSIFFSLLITTLLGFSLELDFLVYGFALLGAVLPDIDHPHSIVGRIFWPISLRLDRIFGHRTITHSLLGFAVISLLAAPLLLLKKEYYLFFVLAYFSHIVLDMANVRGVLFLWPSRRPHVWGKNRLATGSPKELSFSALFIVLSFLTLPLSKYGLKTSLGYMLGDHRSASRIMLRSDKRIYLDFEAVNTLTRQPLAGKALVLDRVDDKYFIIAYENKIYTISDYGNADLLSSKERIDYTDEPEQRLPLNYEARSFVDVLAELPESCYLKGTLYYPKNYYLSLSSELNERIKQSGNKLEFEFVSRTELAGLKWQKEVTAEEKSAERETERYRLAMNAVLKELKESDGLTDLGRQKLGIDYTKHEKYLTARSKYLTARQEYLNIQKDLANNENWIAKFVVVAI